MEEIKKEFTVYVLLRQDLPSMNSGKAAAQVHHAGVQMVAKSGSSRMVNDYIVDGVEQGADFFNTTLVLGATMDDINRVTLAATGIGPDVVLFNTVVDPSYPFFVESIEVANLIPQTDKTRIVKILDNGKVLMVREETTCAWFLGDRNDPRFRSLFDGLDLHP